MQDIKPFPIPVVAAAGAFVEDETLDYIAMPQGMDTFRLPVLPEPEEIAQHAGAVEVLHALVQALDAVVTGQVPEACVSLQGLSAADLLLLNQVLGEGEVSAQVMGEHDVARVRVQESVFAGVWRVIECLSDGAVKDHIEVAAIPQILLDAALEDGHAAAPAKLSVPAEMVNVPSVLVELEDQRQRWQSGQPAQVVNLSLLPLSPQDIGFLDHQLGTGRVLMLSRGYGNCRITNCRVPHTWRVVYYNSQDAVILNTVEVVGVPEVACAAPEDLADSLERLREVVQWVEQA
jgi:hydrogenase-1 operon protein HyaF